MVIKHRTSLPISKGKAAKGEGKRGRWSDFQGEKKRHTREGEKLYRNAHVKYKGKNDAHRELRARKNTLVNHWPVMEHNGGGLA